MKILRKEDYNYSILYIENENKCSAYKRLADGNWMRLNGGDWSSVKNVDELEKAFKEINMSKLPIDDCRQQIEKEFVPYDLALRLKVLGFEESCLAYYESQDKNLVINFNSLPLTEEQKKRPGLYTIDNRNGVLPQWAVAAPTWRAAFKWFKDKHKLKSWIQEHSKNTNFIYEIRPHICAHYKEGETYVYKTSEKTELACLKKLCEIVESK